MLSELAGESLLAGNRCKCKENGTPKRTQVSKCVIAVYARTRIVCVQEEEEWREMEHEGKDG